MTKTIGVEEQSKEIVYVKQEYTSIYKGVSLYRGKWRAQVTQNGVNTYIGSFENEVDAAIAVNKKCEELGIAPKNPDVLNVATICFPKSCNAKVSQYVGVYWTNSQKWKARIHHNSVSHYLGIHETEEDAAHAVNVKCIEIGIEPKNPEILQSGYNKEPTMQRVIRSKYDGVYWDSRLSKWKGKIHHWGRTYSVGEFSTDRDAAIALNNKCEVLGIAPKNPCLSKNPAKAIQHTRKKATRNRRSYKEKTSKYVGVYWSSKDQNWKTRVYNKQKSYYVGCFDNEMEAAHAVNRKCLELAIPLKNPELRTEPQNVKLHRRNSRKTICAPIRTPGQRFNMQAFHTRASALQPTLKFNANLRHNIKTEQKTAKKKDVNNQLSHYSGVYKTVNGYKWQAQVYHGGKLHYAGLYARELDAALAVNAKCRELGMKPKNPLLESPVHPHLNYSCNITLPRKRKFGADTTIGEPKRRRAISLESRSKYPGVFREEGTNKWMCLLKIKEDFLFLGEFLNENLAGFEVYKTCVRLNIPLPKFPDFEPLAKNITLKPSYRLVKIIVTDEGACYWEYLDQYWTPYFGVSWTKEKSAWEAKQIINGELYLGGYFSNVENAAIAADILLQKYDKTADRLYYNFPNRQYNYNSVYIGVFWNEMNKSWDVRRMWNNRTYCIHNMSYRTDLEAAFISDALQLYLKADVEEHLLNFPLCDTHIRIIENKNLSLQISCFDMLDASFIANQFPSMSYAAQNSLLNGRYHMMNNLNQNPMQLNFDGVEDIIKKRIPTNKVVEMVNQMEVEDEKQLDLCIIDGTEEFSTTIDTENPEKVEEEENVSPVVDVKKSPITYPSAPVPPPSPDSSATVPVAVEIEVEEEEEDGEKGEDEKTAIMSKNDLELDLDSKTVDCPEQPSKKRKLDDGSYAVTVSESITSTTCYQVKPLNKWSQKEVSTFLDDINLPLYKEVFMQNYIDGEVLTSLDREQCKVLGVQLFHIPKILNKIQEWKHTIKA